MKNFIAELLVKLAEKEDEANALRIQVDALDSFAGSIPHGLIF